MILDEIHNFGGYDEASGIHFDGWDPGAVENSFCPGEYRDPSCSPGNGLASLPSRLAAKIKAKVDDHYAKLSERYGPRWAKVIVGSALAGLPLPVPGSSFITAAPALALAELYRRLTANFDPRPMSEDEVKAAAAELLADLRREFAEE